MNNDTQCKWSENIKMYKNYAGGKKNMLWLRINWKQKELTNKPSHML